MDQKEFLERTSRLKEVGKVIESLPSEIRGDAFGLLRGYVSKDSASDAADGEAENQDGVSENNSDLFSKFEHQKPSDNVRLITAYFFQEYGAEPFSADDVKSTASNVGITIPERIDMTLSAAVENGKQLFTKAGRGLFKPTVHGESYLRATYSVRKGTKKREAQDK